MACRLLGSFVCRRFCRGGRAPRTGALTFCGNIAERRRFWRAVCARFCRGGRAPRTGAPTFCGNIAGRRRFWRGRFAGGFIAEGGRPERAPLHLRERCGEAPVLAGGLRLHAAQRNGGVPVSGIPAHRQVYLLIKAGERGWWNYLPARRITGLPARRMLVGLAFLRVAGTCWGAKMDHWVSLSG